MASFTNLPEDLQMQILLGCDLSSYRAVSLTCKTLHSLCKDDCFGVTHILKYVLTHPWMVAQARAIDTAQMFLSQILQQLEKHEQECNGRWCPTTDALKEKRDIQDDYLFMCKLHKIGIAVALATRAGSAIAVRRILETAQHMSYGGVTSLWNFYMHRLSHNYDVRGMAELLQEYWT